MKGCPHGYHQVLMSTTFDGLVDPPDVTWADAVGEHTYTSTRSNSMCVADSALKALAAAAKVKR
jgi:hypothetical protein